MVAVRVRVRVPCRTGAGMGMGMGSGMGGFPLCLMLTCRLQVALRFMLILGVAITGGWSLEVGDRVEAKWNERNVHYPGKITAVNTDGTFAVAFDDGDARRRVRLEEIKGAVPPPSGGATQRDQPSESGACMSFMPLSPQNCPDRYKRMQAEGKKDPGAAQRIKNQALLHQKVQIFIGGVDMGDTLDDEEIARISADKDAIEGDGPGYPSAASGKAKANAKAPEENDDDNDDDDLLDVESFEWDGTPSASDQKYLSDKADESQSYRLSDDEEKDDTLRGPLPKDRPNCPAETIGRRSELVLSPPGGASEVSSSKSQIIFRNDAPFNVTLIWVSEKGLEVVRLDIMPPTWEVSVDTTIGSLWRVRQHHYHEAYRYAAEGKPAAGGIDLDDEEEDSDEIPFLNHILPGKLLVELSASQAAHRVSIVNCNVALHSPFDLKQIFASGIFTLSAGRMSVDWGSRSPGMDIHDEIDITLDQVETGFSQELQWTRYAVCEACQGLGTVNKHDLVPCNDCHNSGQHRRGHQLGAGYNQHFSKRCNKCKGYGTTVVKGMECPVCGGTRMTAEHKSAVINIPAGVQDGWRHILVGQGNETLQQSAGDRVVSVKVLKHPLYARNGSDLVRTLNISLSEALVGFERNLTLPGGRHLHVYRNEMSSPETEYDLPDKGLPLFPVNQSHPHQRGILRLKFVVYYPTNKKWLNKISDIIL